MPREVRKLVKKYRGWIENNRAYFPSVYLKEEFLKECASLGWYPN